MICYSIMYGDNAIFPNDRVRLPINPAYPAELKRAIELLLERQQPLFSPQAVLRQIEFPAHITKTEIRERREGTAPSHFVTGNIFEAGQDGEYEFEEVEVIGLAEDYQLGQFALLEESPLYYLRLILKVLLVSALLVMLFFYPFIRNAVRLLLDFSSYEVRAITVDNL